MPSGIYKRTKKIGGWKLSPTACKNISNGHKKITALEKEDPKVLEHPVTNIGHPYVADFYLPLYNIVLEVDGKWCHNYPDGREIDRTRTQELEQAGYKVLRFWEGQFDAQSIWREI